MNGTSPAAIIFWVVIILLGCVWALQPSRRKKPLAHHAYDYVKCKAYYGSMHGLNPIGEIIASYDLLTEVVDMDAMAYGAARRIPIMFEDEPWYVTAIVQLGTHFIVFAVSEKEIFDKATTNSNDEEKTDEPEPQD